VTAWSAIWHGRPQRVETGAVAFHPTTRSVSQQVTSVRAARRLFEDTKTVAAETGVLATGPGCSVPHDLRRGGNQDTVTS